jgi:hypothetical protein
MDLATDHAVDVLLVPWGFGTVVPAQRFPRTVAVAPIWHDLVVMLLGEGVLER